MEFKMKDKVIVKLFAGCKVDPGLRHHLDRSGKWKNAKLHPEQELVLIPYQGDEYLGTYISAPGTTVAKLEFVDEEVRRKIKEYCPKYNDKQLVLQIFSQVFVQ